ncbi:hypothetical protein L3Q82_009736, partial [Scortum barcoo]
MRGICVWQWTEKLIRAQQADSTLDKCRSAVQEKSGTSSVTYLFDDGVLLRKWSPVSGMECDVVAQVVVLKEFRLQVLSLAHDHWVSSHLGIKKTRNWILRYFFWLGVKSDVVKFCHSCHICQITGKPNQVMSELAAKHQVSSSYHPESQGALERFHQTLKSML